MALARYDVTSGYIGRNWPQDFLTVRDKATQQVLLEVKPGEFPAAEVPFVTPFWAFEGSLCVYGAAKNGQGVLKAFDLSANLDYSQSVKPN